MKLLFMQFSVAHYYKTKP